MKKSIFLSAIAACMLLFSSCKEAPETTAAAENETAAAPAPAKPDLAQIKTEIQAAENAWAAALNARDLNALMAMYTDDAVSMPDNEPMQVGKAAIQKAQEAEFKNMPKDMNFAFEALDVYGDGETVTETGKSTYKDATGKVTGTGKYMVVWKKQDGKYLCIREIYNRDSKE